MNKQVKFKKLLTGACQSHSLAVLNLTEKIDRELSEIQSLPGFHKVISLSHAISSVKANTTYYANVFEGSAIITYEVD